MSNTPQIRFAGFTDAWEQRKLSDLFEERNEQAPMDEEYPLMAFIANIGVAPKGDRYDRSALVHDEKGKKYKRTEKGDFIYSSNNLETGSIGLNNYGNACISPVYSIFKSKHTVDPEFMGRILLRKEFINQMVSFRQGVVYGQWKIHEDDFLNLDILVPQTTEQQKIGGFFSELDKIITLHQRECFSFDFSGESAKTAQKTISWEQRKLSDLFEERNEQAPMDEEYPLMAFIANIGVAPKGDRYDRSALVHDEKGKKYKRTEKGDFIYSSNNLETGSIGLNNYGNACISPVYSIFKSKHTVDPEFMGRILLRKEFINQMVSFRQGVVYGQWKIHEDDFLNLDILVPQTTEQQKIGGFFSELDKIITLHQHKPNKKDTTL